MSRKRCQIQEWAVLSDASQADLGEAEARLATAVCALDDAAELFSRRSGFSARDIDRAVKLGRDVRNLLFNIRSRLPAPLTGDASEYLGGNGGSHA